MISNLRCSIASVNSLLQHDVCFQGIQTLSKRLKIKYTVLDKLLIVMAHLFTD